MPKGNLLLVDDEALILEQMKAILEDSADNIFTAPNGLEALKTMEREVIHCVVCDINMPELNGVEVIKRLRAKDNRVPFIFYTGHGHQQLMLEALKYGAFDFLDKPNMMGLEDIVTKALNEGLNGPAASDETLFISDYRKLVNRSKNA